MSEPSDPRQPAPGDVPALSDDHEIALDAHGYNPADYDWVPVLRKPRADGWSPQRQQAFIGALADTGSVMTAARQVGMSASTAYRLRRSADGAAFAAAWDVAIQQAAHALVDAAFERAINGSDEPVFDRDGNRVGRRFRQSDGLIMFLLRKHFPERYGDIGRDRADRLISLPAAKVADIMSALGPVQPADPAALMHPDDAEIAFLCAHIGDGRVPHWHRQDGSVERDAHLAVPDAAFEAALEAAKREADPVGYAAAEARIADYEQEEAELAEHRARPRRRRAAATP